jgi:hypothetical protein
MDGGSTLAWLGEDSARMEVAHVERRGDALTIAADRPDETATEVLLGL